MSTQLADPFEGTPLSYFRSNNIRGITYGVGKDPKNLWILFSRPEYLEIDQMCKADLKRVEWIDDKNMDNPLNDLMMAYVNHTQKLKKYAIDSKTLSNTSTFNCELAKALDIDFSKDFASMISRLMGIVKGYISLVSNQSQQEYLESDVYEKVKWIISELLPTLFIWIIELHIERTTLVIYADNILNYITQVFLLLQAETYVIEAEKMMIVRKHFIIDEQDEKDNKINFIDAVNTTLSSKFSGINKKIKNIINTVTNDDNLSASEKNVTLAAIYNLRYKTDKSLVTTNMNDTDKPSDYNGLTIHYKQWLDIVNTDCKLVDNLLRNNNSGIYVKERICTSLGNLTRKSINPASINKSGKYPVTPASTSQ